MSDGTFQVDRDVWMSIFNVNIYDTLENIIKRQWYSLMKEPHQIASPFRLFDIPVIECCVCGSVAGGNIGTAGFAPYLSIPGRHAT